MFFPFSFLQEILFGGGGTWHSCRRRRSKSGSRSRTLKILCSDVPFWQYLLCVCWQKLFSSYVALFVWILLHTGRHKLPFLCFKVRQRFSLNNCKTKRSTFECFLPPKTLKDALHVLYRRHFMFMMWVNTKDSILLFFSFFFLILLTNTYNICTT